MRGPLASAAYRIAFVYAAAFALATALLGLAVYFAADAEFRRERDRAITEEVERVAGIGSIAEIAEDVNERSRVKGHDAFLYALFNRTGRRVAGLLDAPAPPPGIGNLVFSDQREGADTARARTRLLAGGYRLTVGVDAESIERIDATILALFGAAFVAILIVGAIGATLLGGYLRRRLGAITRTAEAIVGGDLGQRVAVGTRQDEFDQVAAAINAMLDRIAGLMENLRQVSSDVAHDLRTPLMRLRRQLDQVGRAPGAAERAIQQADALLALFTAILRVAEVESGAGSLPRTDTDLSALVADVVEAYQPAMEDSGHPLGWTIATAVHVPGDRDLLGQALVNLLDNARVHTPRGTPVRVALADEGTLARLSVRDNGPGVPAGDRARIVQRFVRAEASRSTPGHGLGLTLARAVAEAHGGNLAVEDAAPGLQVTITLPKVHR